MAVQQKLPDSPTIGPLGDVGASHHERLEGLDIFKQQPVLDHTSIVFLQGFQGVGKRCGPDRPDVI